MVLVGLPKMVSNDVDTDACSKRVLLWIFNKADLLFL